MNYAGLDIVLPCYNPLDGWEENVIQTYHRLLSKLPDVHIKLIIVNDGSVEGVGEQSISKLSSEINDFLWLDLEENKGKGFALRHGIAHSKQDFTIFTDIDFPYTDQSIQDIFSGLNEKAWDVAIGVKGDNYYQKLPPLRARVSRFLRWLARNFLRISITDTQCGLKGFNQKGREIFLQTSIDRYLADLEFIYLVDRSRRLKMKSVTVTLKDGVEFSSVNVKILFREGVNFLKVWWRFIFGF